MLEVYVEDEAVRLLIVRGKRLSYTAFARLRTVVDRASLHVLRRAMKRTPAAEGILRRSGKADVHMSHVGQLVAEVTFGGLAEAYAEVQHENEDFVHTKADFAAKWPMRKVPKKGYKGGQAHFLYGSPDAAWNATEERMVKALIARRLHEVAGEELHA